MNKRDWLLLFLRQANPREAQSLDPIRIQKGMFYFARSAAVPSGEKYDFIPYYFGPCSFAIYEDVDGLVANGTVEAVPVPGQTWRKYQLTAAGISRAARLASSANAEALDACSAARARVTKHTFRGLLKEVYKDYPEYAAESVVKNLP